MATQTSERPAHTMDLILQTMEQFAAPSRTDGLSTADRVALPAVQESLSAAAQVSRGRFFSKVAGRI